MAKAAFAKMTPELKAIEAVMGPFISRRTVGFYSRSDQSFLGVGTLVSIQNGVPAIITADHVCRRFDGDTVLFCQPTPGSMERVDVPLHEVADRGEGNPVGSGPDIALLRLKLEVRDRLPQMAFLCEDQMADAVPEAMDFLVWTVGSPLEARERVKARIKAETLQGFVLLLTHLKDETECSRQAHTEKDRPDCGGGVWSCPDSDGHVWSPEKDARLLGVNWYFNDALNCVRATPVHNVHPLIVRLFGI